MKDAYEVLHQKEAEFARVRREVESLNLVVCLLADDDNQGDFAELGDSDKKPANSVADSISRQSELRSTSAPRPRSSASESRLQWPNLTKATR